MTDPRDLRPPPATQPPLKRVEELVIGWDMETLYLHYSDSFMVLVGVTADRADELADIGHRLTNHFADLGMSSDELEILDHDNAQLLVRTGARVLLDRDGVSRPRREAEIGEIAETGRRIEALMVKARKFLPAHRRRYYDIGVMFNRLALCAAVPKNAALNPGSFLDLPAKILNRYRAEFSRVARRLVSLCLSKDDLLDPSNHAHEPDFPLLDNQLAEFARWLADWIRHHTEADDEFFERLSGIFHNVGFFRLDGPYYYAVTLPEPLDDTDEVPESSDTVEEADDSRVPLCLPYSASSLQGVELTWQALRSTLLTDPRGCRDRLIELRDLSRYVLGPVHPLTLEMQVDLAYAYAADNQVVVAVVLVEDTIATPVHYYGGGHATTFLIIGAAYEFYTAIDPQEAAVLYDEGLRRFLETPPSGLPEHLRTAHATLSRTVKRPPAQS